MFFKELQFGNHWVMNTVSVKTWCTLILYLWFSWNSCEMTATPHALIHISSPVRGVLFCMFTRCCLLSFLSPSTPSLSTLSTLHSPPSPPCNLVFTPSSSTFSSYYLLTCAWYVDRWLPRAVQQQREVCSGSERVALRLPVRMERPGLRRGHRNALLRWQR